jgi:aminopeptidase-like protein
MPHAKQPDFASAGIDELGLWMHDLLRRLFPICRSLTGPGNRQTLGVVRETVDMYVSEIPSGEKAFDWAVPDEWRPRSAEIVGPDGLARARFADNNLHLVGYSEPVDCELDLADLLPRIHTLPDEPDLIPYVTSYYERSWGFAMSERDKRSLPPGRYRVLIDAELAPGTLTLGEAVLPGESPREVLISTYICHPSMANDNLSGVVVAAALHGLVAALPRRTLTYRFLWAPETVGVIAWLARNAEAVRARTHAGLVLSCVGDEGSLTWKSSRRGDAEVDRVARAALARFGPEHVVAPFSPAKGSDERQYCSPGFNLPIGLLTRSVPGRFRYYHTSGDTADFVTPAGLAGSLAAAYAIVEGLEANARRWRRIDPFCEPMLSKRGLYHTTSIRKRPGYDVSADPLVALRWVLNYADGEHSLLDVAELSGLALPALGEAAQRAAAAGVLESC